MIMVKRVAGLGQAVPGRNENNDDHDDKHDENQGHDHALNYDYIHK